MQVVARAVVSEEAPAVVQVVTPAPMLAEDLAEALAAAAASVVGSEDETGTRTSRPIRSVQARRA